MKRILIILLFSLLFFKLSAQSKVEFTYQLLVPDLIAEACLDQDSFLEWIKKTQEEIEKHLKTEKGNKDIIILVSLQNDKNATVQIGAKPGILGEKSKKALLDIIGKYDSPRTKIMEYSFIIYAQINEGADKDMEFSPQVIPPRYKEHELYTKLNTVQKQEHIKKWLQNEIIPILAYHGTKVDKKFAGVLSMGKMLDKVDYENLNVEELTDKNPKYWRALMEMEQGNQIIPFAKACLYIANGEFDKAGRLLSVISYFSEKETLASILQNAIYEKLTLFDKELHSSINEGIELHDEGKYKQAVQHYQKLLTDFPNSAWLQYEYFFSNTEDKLGNRNTKEFDKAWNEAKKVIYSCDPMYHMSIKASSGKEGYLLFRRQEINNLFKSKDTFASDFIKYADIALDLESYAFAAELYWLIFSHFPEKLYDGRNILAHYLYCLDKLGDTETIKNFEGNFKKEFKDIEKKREDIMKKSTIYNSFETQD